MRIFNTEEIIFILDLVAFTLVLKKKKEAESSSEGLIENFFLGREACDTRNEHSSNSFFSWL